MLYCLSQVGSAALAPSKGVFALLTPFDIFFIQKIFLIFFKNFPKNLLTRLSSCAIINTTKEINKGDKPNERTSFRTNQSTLHEDDYEVSCYEALVGGEEVMITLHDLEVDYETEEWLERPFSDFEAILELVQWLTDSCFEKTYYGDFPAFRFEGFTVLVVDEWTV